MTPERYKQVGELFHSALELGLTRGCAFSTSRALVYIDMRLTNLWSQPVDGGEPAQLTAFRGDQVFSFDYSPDGQWLAVARGRVTDDVVLISDLK